VDDDCARGPTVTSDDGLEEWIAAIFGPRLAAVRLSGAEASVDRLVTTPLGAWGGQDG
jgi:hypothetical protein